MTDESTSRSYADIYPYDVNWLWRNRIPMAEITIMAARGGTGKGMLCADIAGRVTTGRPMIDGGTTPMPPQHVLMASTEDDPNSVTVNRLIASGADLPRVHDITGITLPEGMPTLANSVADLGGEVATVVLDPLSAICTGGVWSVPRVRAAFTPLQRWANETGTSVILTHHLTKDGKIGGSPAVVDSVRSVLLIERDPVTPDTRIVSVHKSNAGVFPSDVAYTITGDGSNAHVQWLTDTSEDNAGSIEQLLALMPDDQNPVSSRVLARQSGLQYPMARALLARMTTERVAYEPFDGWYAKLGDGVRA